MIKVSYDHKCNTLMIEFIGKIDAAQAEHSFLDVKKVLPKQAKGFKLLTDFTLAERMDIGFNILSAFHYSKKVAVLTLQSRDEAQAKLMSG